VNFIKFYIIFGSPVLSHHIVFSCCYGQLTPSHGHAQFHEQIYPLKVQETRIFKLSALYVKFYCRFTSLVNTGSVYWA